MLARQDAEKVNGKANFASSSPMGKRRIAHE